jgi:RNA polymerase sigma-70 factor (ECF subfamily)
MAFERIITGLSNSCAEAGVVTSSCPGLLISENRPHSRNRQRIIELYDALRPSMHAYLCCLGMSSDQAEDIIQETFLRLVRHPPEHGTEDNLRSWVFRVAHNLSMDIHRSQRRWSCTSGDELRTVVRERMDPAPNPEQKVILEERSRRLGDAVAQLTPKQRHCVLLRAEGLRYREIAAALGISVQRVGELVQRAISLLEGET